MKNLNESENSLNRAISIARTVLNRQGVSQEITKMGDAFGLTTTVVVMPNGTVACTTEQNITKPVEIPKGGHVFFYRNNHLRNGELTNPIHVKEESGKGNKKRR